MLLHQTVVENKLEALARLCILDQGQILQASGRAASEYRAVPPTPQMGEDKQGENRVKSN